MTTSEFQSKVANANALDFGTIFNQSIELFKKSWIQGFLMQLFLMLFFLPFFLMLYLPVIFTIISQSQAGEYNPNSLEYSNPITSL